MHYVSNGFSIYDWNGDYVKHDDRWCDRFAILEEEQLAARLKRSLDHVYDAYFGFEQSLIVTAYTVLRSDSKEKYNLDEGFVLLQLLYTHPSRRGNGACKRFILHAMKLAEEKEARLAAVCHPFVHVSETTGEEPPSPKQIAKDFADNPNETLVYLSGDEEREAQENMAALLKSFGWSQVDLRAGMQNPERYGEWAFWTGDGK